MDYLWVLVLLILGVCMVCYPKILWKIENLFTVKNGEPTELYLVLMRIGGVFFIICSVGMIIYLVTNHQFNWWFDFSPPKGYITTRPTGRCHKHFYWSAIKRYY